ncbi:MAG: 3-ketoacyl-ACP reductase [Rhodobacteraceae bacterium]|nr:3-ketoacyl-ACP reductase [Paracoccaceae bacterium]
MNDKTAALQVALVTGSSRGIGLATALELARAGFDIALNTFCESNELDAAVTQIETEGVKAFKAVFDVSKIDSHKAALDAIESHLGPITTLVNNAGVGVLDRGDPLNVTEESYDRCFDVNAKAMFFLTQAFVKRLVNRTRIDGLFYSIVNVTSSSAVAVSVARSEYCASKAAAAMTSKMFAVRLGELSIPVFDVQPGLIATELTAAVIESYQKRAEDGLCLFPRVGQAKEVGMVIASLATGKIPYTTGQVISVDGGLLVPHY